MIIRIGTSFLSTDCELSTNPCSKNVYNIGPWSCSPSTVSSVGIVYSKVDISTLLYTIISVTSLPLTVTLPTLSSYFRIPFGTILLFCLDPTCFPPLFPLPPSSYIAIFSNGTLLTQSTFFFFFFFRASIVIFPGW